MIVISVSVTAKDDGLSSFEDTLRDVVEDARQTPGCEKYEWYRSPDNLQRYIIYGEFASREDFEAYLTSAVVQRIGGELIPLLATKPEFRHYEARILEEG